MNRPALLHPPLAPRRLLLRAAAAGVAGLAVLRAGPARADAADLLRRFTREVKTARADFTQTVTATEGGRKKVSSGSFEFARPNRFRFAYRKPFEQTIVSDGQKVWIHDPDLNQVSVRPLAQALAGTPAALLAGGELERGFTLTVQPAADGLDWVQARPKAGEGSVREMRVGFRDQDLAALEILDAFGQRSLLQFSRLVTGLALPPEDFRFVVPPGADVLTS